MQSWCRTWPPNGSKHICAKQKLHKKPREACKSSWNPKGILMSLTLTIPWNSAKLVKIFPGIIVRRHHTDPKQMVIAGRAVRRVEEGTSAVLLQSGQNEKVGGQIRWNVTPICETSQISYLMGRRPMKDVLGNHLKDLLFHLVHWLSITLISAKDQSRIHQFGKKVLPGLFLGYALYAGGIWKGDVLIADLEELETMDASKMYSKKTQCERGDISQGKRRIYFSNRRWTNQNPWRRSGTWEHPPRYGSDQFKENVTLNCLENQKGLFHHLKTHFRMLVKR